MTFDSPKISESSDQGSGLEPKAPVAKRIEFERTNWGDTRVDHYQWLENRESPEVITYLEAENAYTEAILAPVEDLQLTLFEEIKARIKETDMSVPISHGPWSYFSRTFEGSPYGLHCRKPSVPGGAALVIAEEPSADEQILLDENAEADGYDFFEVGIFDVSPDHNMLLWAADRTGDERYDAVVQNLTTGEIHDDGLNGLSYGSAWATDNKTFFYIRPDETNRPYQVWRHEVGRPATEDVLVMEEQDERFFVGVGREKDDSFIQIGISSKVTDEVWIIPADQPKQAPRAIAERQQGREYSAAHRADQFIILTNDQAQNFRVVTVADHDPSFENWEELVASQSSVMISDMDVSQDFLTLFERTEGSTRIRIRSWQSGEISSVDQPESVSTSWPGANPNFDSPKMRFGYSSMVTPPSIYELDVATGERELLKQQEVLGDFDASEYVSAREWVNSGGVQVPVSLVWRRDRAPGPGPCLLYGYGAYEASIDPAFSSARLSLLDRGFCFAIVHARGGGEMGRQWYLDGKFDNKTNTFADVEAAARHLIESGRTTPSQLVLRGGSAGGLMAGAVVNNAPELFAGVVAQVPFVDALTTILDPTQPLTVTEWEEWGNPLEDEAIYSIMKSYSPYDNVANRHYPSILATAGLHDTRVNFWEPAKWVQRLRNRSASENPILLLTDLTSGHGGPSGRYDAWKEEARILSYILWVVEAEL